MVFVILGTQKQSFERLLREIESCKLLENEQIIAQVGHTKYESDRIKTINFLSKEEFNKYIEESEFVITHGGVGSIFTSLLKNKKVLAVPRLKKYNEHVDDHQIEICEKLASLDYIVYYNPDDYIDEENPPTLENKINFLRTNIFRDYTKDDSYLNILDNCIEEMFLK